MSTSTCKHRYVAHVVIEDEEMEDGIDFEFHALSSCDLAKAFLDEQKQRPDALAVEFMGTNVKHFVGWTVRATLKARKQDHDES